LEEVIYKQTRPGRVSVEGRSEMEQIKSLKVGLQRVVLEEIPQAPLCALGGRTFILRKVKGLDRKELLNRRLEMQVIM
jgi:hypothetical protein